MITARHDAPRLTVVPEHRGGYFKGFRRLPLLSGLPIGGLVVAQRKEFQMDHTDVMHHGDGWMNGWAGGGMWVWTVIGIVVVVLLVVVIVKLYKK